MNVVEQRNKVKMKVISSVSSHLFESTCIRFSECKLSASVYMDSFSDVELLAGRFSSIDKCSKDHIRKSESFKSFLQFSLNLIESKHSFFQTKLEKLIDDGEENYRLTYYLQPTYSRLIVEQNKNVADNVIYNKLITNLSTRDKQLKLEMVLDERSL